MTRTWRCTSSSRGAADGPALELGVGSGRVALHLARAGHDVVGIDRSAAMLEQARARLDGALAERVRLVEGDMRDFDFGDEQFGLIYCALGTFGHLIETEDQVATLRCVARHLGDGGVFVAQVQPVTAVDWSAAPGPLSLDWTRTDPATGEHGDADAEHDGIGSAADDDGDADLRPDRIGRDGAAADDRRNAAGVRAVRDGAAVRTGGAAAGGRVRRG